MTSCARSRYRELRLYPVLVIRSPPISAHWTPPSRYIMRQLPPPVKRLLYVYCLINKFSLFFFSTSESFPCLTARAGKAYVYECGWGDGMSVRWQALPDIVYTYNVTSQQGSQSPLAIACHSTSANEQNLVQAFERGLTRPRSPSQVRHLPKAIRSLLGVHWTAGSRDTKGLRSVYIHGTSRSATGRITAS
jgi:hypothetical protein